MAENLKNLDNMPHIVDSMYPVPPKVTFWQNKDWCFLGTWELEWERQLLKVTIFTKNDRDKTVNLLIEYLVNNLQICYKISMKILIKNKTRDGEMLSL